MKKILMGFGLASIVATSSFAASDFYLKGGVGISKSKSTETSFVDISGGADGADFGSENFEAYSLGVGYNVTKYYNVELMLNHTPGFDLKGSTINNGVYDNNRVTEAKINHTSLVLNNIFNINSLLEKNWILEPYIGFGLGLVKYDYSDLSVTSSISNIVDSIKSNTGTNFVWKAIVGTTYPITKNIDFDLSYAYADYGTFESSKNVDNTNLELQTSADIEIKAHEVLFALRYKF